jgi:hypothetical protein
MKSNSAPSWRYLHPTTKAAAVSIGVAEPTLWRWQQDDAFQSAYRRARRLVVSQAIARIQKASLSAVEALVEIANDKTIQKAARISAAKAIIDYSLRGIEIEDQEERISKLEAMLS